MIKKITVAVLLTIFILALPIRLLGLSQNLELVVKLGKGLLFIYIIIVLMRRESIFKKSLLLRKIPPKTYRTLIPVAILVIAYLVYGIGKQLNEFDATVSIVALSMAASLVAATAEEFVFRGYIFNLLRQGNKSLIRSLIISSTIFATVHIGNVFRYDDIWSAVNQVVFAFVLGMLFGSVYALTRNLLVVSLFHFFVNIPAALQTVSPVNSTATHLLPSTFSDNVISLIFMIILMIPFLMLAFYYLKVADKNTSREQNLAMVNE